MEATSPTTNMIFSELFRGGGTNLGAKVKMMILYNRGLTDEKSHKITEFQNQEDDIKN